MHDVLVARLIEMDHKAVTSSLGPPFALVNLIMCCALILSVAQGCDPTKESPTPEITTPFALSLGR